nr:MAG TPA: hypothetical protein [Caudoviricetes sp.]
MLHFSRNICMLHKRFSESYCKYYAGEQNNVFLFHNIL